MIRRLICFLSAVWSGRSACGPPAGKCHGRIINYGIATTSSRTGTTASPARRRLAWVCLALLPLAGAAPAQPPELGPPVWAMAGEEEPITPVPQPPPADPLRLALGESLFSDQRLSYDGAFACVSCHDVHSNGADSGRTMPYGTSVHMLNVPTVFNAALSFRLNWEGNYHTLEEQAQASLESKTTMRSSVDTVIAKLNADPGMAERFRDAYGHSADRASLLDAIATYERSLLTPESRFDRWLAGDKAALTPEEQHGYALFKSLGCVSCHQGVNIGGNLYQRHGIFRPLAASQPEVLRVPSLRNVATTAPYFHDGSALTLAEAVRQMAAAQLDEDLSEQEINAIIAFFQTLTGTYQGHPVVPAPR
jgi:cytochrome c peroxidase